MLNLVKKTCELPECGIEFEREQRQIKGKRSFCSRLHGIKYYAAHRADHLDHGNYGMYRKGCRCALCCCANTIRMNNYRMQKTQFWSYK